MVTSSLLETIDIQKALLTSLVSQPQLQIMRYIRLLPLYLCLVRRLHSSGAIVRDAYIEV